MESILGIDLGTTNSVVSIVRDGKVQVIEEGGSALLPSVVGLDSNGEFLIGTLARNQYVLAPERTIRSIKRKMGETGSVRLGDGQYTPQEMSAFILRELKERAQRLFGEPITKAVITVPAFFSEVQREATREAGELAGLEVVRIINEPTAASLTYEPQSEKMERLLVYDLGGGTFDVSIVQIEMGVVEVLASHGDTRLGGDDFDQLLLDHVCDKFASEHGIDLRQIVAAKSRLVYAVEDAKKRLSFEPFVAIQEEFIAEKDGTPLHVNFEIARAEYEDLIEPLLSKTLTCVDKALSDSKLQATQIDKVLLVGGSTRTPFVRRLLEEQLGQPVHSEVDPDLCVAMGAAIQGALIAGADVGPVLVDITPHTLGIQCLGEIDGIETLDRFAAIIERNTALPASRSDVFYTSIDGQSKVRINVFQGEHPNINYNEKIGEFLLDGLADVESGNKILVSFALDLDGILQVTAAERATGRDKRLTIQNAMQKFRENHQVAKDRIDAAFGSASIPEPSIGLGVMQKVDADGPRLSPELEELIGTAQELITAAENVRDNAAPEDHDELDSLVAQLNSAISEQSAAKIKLAQAELEDLVFYLQDA